MSGASGELNTDRRHPEPAPRPRDRTTPLRDRADLRYDRLASGHWAKLCADNEGDLAVFEQRRVNQIANAELLSSDCSYAH
jgi:hypothetical protein